MQMRTYSVFQPPVLPGTVEDDAQSLVFVRHGWSLAALLVPLIWMLVRRLWWVLLAYVVWIIAIQLLDFAIPSLITVGLSLATALIIMLEAGQLRLETMAAKGYREIAVVEAANQTEAERRFFAWWLAQRDRSGGPAETSQSALTSATHQRSPVLRPSSTRSPALPGLTNR